MSLLLRCTILGLLVNTLTANENYLVLRRNNLKIPIHMQLSQKLKTFSQFFSAFLKSRLNFKYFESNDDRHRFCISEITDSENVLISILKSLVSEALSRSNFVNVNKHYWNLHHSRFIILIGHWKQNCVRKSPSYWHTKSWDLLLTHWLPMKCMLFLTETI